MRVIVPYLVDDDALLSSSIAETDHAAWASGTTYTLGARVIRTETHRIYESIRTTNLGRTPETSPEWWYEVGPTNRWAMFDGSASTASTAAGSIAVSVSTPGPVNDIVLTEVIGSSVSISLPGYSGTVSVPTPTAPATTSTVYVSGIGSPGGTLTLTVTGSGDVEVGALSVGNITALGETQLGSSIGIIDYSTRLVDEFGSATFARRGYSKRIAARVVLPTADIDRVGNVLAALRSVPCVWIATDAYLSMIAYGYFKDWQITLDNYVTSSADITVESLVLDALPAEPPVIELPETPSIPLDLSDPGVSSVAPPGSTSAEAGYALGNDGRARYWAKVNGLFTAQAYINGQWSSGGIIAGDVAAQYEAQFGAGSWQPLSAERSVTAYATTGQDVAVNTTARIRRIGTEIVLASAPISLRAAVPVPAPPPPPPPPDPVANLGMASTYSVSGTGYNATLQLSIKSDGTWAVVGDVDGSSQTPTGTPLTGSWHPAPAAGVGVNYQARATLTSAFSLAGVISTVNQLATWTSLSAARTITCTLGIPTSSSATGDWVFTVEVRRISGTNLGTDSLTFTISGTGVAV